MRNTTVLLIAAITLMLGAASLGGANGVSVPTGNGNPSDECAQMNNAFTPTPRCVLVTASTSKFYVYALSTAHTSANACKVNGVYIPPIGIFEENNGIAGLQTATDLRHFALCHPWAGP